MYRVPTMGVGQIVFQGAFSASLMYCIPTMDGLMKCCCKTKKELRCHVEQ